MRHWLGYTSSKYLPSPLKCVLASPGHNTCGCGCKVLEEPPDSGEQRYNSMGSMLDSESLILDLKTQGSPLLLASYFPPKCGGLGPLGHVSPQKVQPELSSFLDSLLESSGECLNSTWEKSTRLGTCISDPQPQSL